MRFITPFKTAAGLGAARSGTLAHWGMTVTGAILAVLTPFFVFTVLAGLVRSGSQAEAIAFFGRPFPAILTGLYVTIGIIHWIHGTRVMVDDYISGTARNWIMVAVTAVGWLLIAIMLWALMRLTTSGAIV